MGGYLMYRNKTTEQVLESAPDSPNYRKLSPDDGTKGIWTFDHSDNGIMYWNMILTDNIKDFISGWMFMYQSFGLNGWDFILDRPLESEGVIAEWNDLLK